MAVKYVKTSGNNGNSGDDLANINRFAAGRTEYGAGDVIDFLLSGVIGSEFEERVLELQGSAQAR